MVYSLVEEAHFRGLKVFVFTVNYPDHIRRMKALGVDGVFTHYPERVLKYQNAGGIIG